MENKISFTGIKNIATVELQRQGFHKSKNLSMILTDDFSGKDLQAFRNELKKLDVDSSKYINKEYPNLLNLEYLHGQESCKAISINGTVLEENDKNLSMFSYLAKLMNKIAQKSDKEMVVNEEYKNYFAKDTLIYGVEIEQYEQLVQDGFIENLFNRDEVCKSAKKFASYIQDMMEKYLGIKK